MSENMPPLNNEQKRIKEICERRNIQWLCHFTPVSNLQLIKEQGLLPRNILPEGALTTDNVRADASNAICLSISSFNKGLAYIKEKTHGYDLCLLGIEPAVLYEKLCLFYPYNAATKCYREQHPINFFGSKALEAMFGDTVIYQKSGYEPDSIRRDARTPDNEPTSEQAEVQCYESIESSFIKRVLYKGNIISF